MLSNNSLVPVMAMVKVSMRSLGLILPELLVSRARKMFLSTMSASHLTAVLSSELKAASIPWEDFSHHLHDLRLG